MACFVAPMAEAIATTVATAVINKKAKKAQANGDLHYAEKAHKTVENVKILNRMLWGGVGLLAFEHVWHGEISPVFPFLTAATEGTEALAEVGFEIATTGVAMAVLVTAVWGVIMLVKRFKSKKVATATNEA